MDISSQEEDNKVVNNSPVITSTIRTHIVSKKSNNNNNNKSKRKLIAPPKNLNLSQRAELDNLPVIQSIQDLVRQYPHMKTDPDTNEPNCEDACNKFQLDMKTLDQDVELRVNIQLPEEQEELSTRNNSLFQIKKSHYNVAEQVPWELELFNEKLSKLSVPELYFNDKNVSNEEFLKMNNQSREQLSRMLRQNALKLPEVSSVLEDQLLHEAGEWTHLNNNEKYFFPPCQFRTDCIANKLVGKIRGLEKGMILMQFMFQQEYMDFYQKKLTHDLPVRPCVLCCRHHLADWVTYLRSMRMDGQNVGTQHVQFEYKFEEVHQFYYNKVGCEHGYDADFMLRALPNESIIESIVTLNSAVLRCETLSNGRRRINQRAIVWKPPSLPEPKIGDTLKNF